jgi:hypothetical protein
MIIQDTHIAVGKYTVSPLAKPASDGGFAASVSIRSGRGSASHDRVLRLDGLFDSAAAALQYATDFALRLLHDRSAPSMAAGCA